MKQNLTAARLNELAKSFLQQYGVEVVDHRTITLQDLAAAIVDVKVTLNPLRMGWFNRKKNDPEIVGASPSPGNEFVVKDTAEFAQFLWALSAAVSEEFRRRLEEHIPQVTEAEEFAAFADNCG